MVHEDDINLGDLGMKDTSSGASLWGEDGWGNGGVSW